MSLLNTLLKFFGESNWAYVLDYESYGIINAKITTPHFFLPSRIVLWTESGNTWSVVRTTYTPPDLWEALQIEENECRLICSPRHYNLHDLFATVNHTPTP